MNNLRKEHISFLQWAGVAVGIILMYKFIDKESLMGVIDKLLPGKEAGLIEGIVMGSREGMSRDFYEKLKISGLVHIVVASGSNMILISRVLIENICSFLGRKKTIILGFAGMWGYAALVGWQPPIVRACVFLSLKYTAQLWGRKFDWVRGLIATIVIMVAADYKMISSISFWMSLTAFVAVSVPKPKWKLMTETVWVSIWMLPILGLAFGKVSLIAPVSNLMVLFLVEVISLIGGGAAIIGLIWTEAAKWMMWLLVPILKYFVFVVEWSSNFGVMNIRFNWLMVVGYYLFLIYLLLRKRGLQNIVLGARKNYNPSAVLEKE